MNFAEELRSSSKKAIEDTALTVSINIQTKLKEFAEQGQSECFMDIPNDRAGVMMNLSNY